MGNSDDYSGYNYSIELQLAGLSYGGTPLTPFQAARLGRTICSKRMAGYTEDQVVDDAEINGPMNSEQAVQTVLGGEYDFCYAYEHDGSIGRGAGPVHLRSKRWSRTRLDRLLGLPPRTSRSRARPSREGRSEKS